VAISFLGNFGDKASVM